MEVSLFLGQGFEEIEANTPICFLRHAGISLQTVSVTGEKVVTGAHGVPVVADVLFEDADFTNLSKHQGLCDLVRQFVSQGKFVAAICAGPMVLGKQGLLKDRTIVCYPGFETFMSGAKVVKDKASVTDGNIITANGPGSAMLFSYNIAKELRGEEAARSMADDMMVNYF